MLALYQFLVLLISLAVFCAVASADRFSDRYSRKKSTSMKKRPDSSSGGSHHYVMGHGFRKPTYHRKRPPVVAPASHRPATADVSQSDFASAVNAAATQPTYRIVCYFPQYAIYRPGVSKITPDQVDANLCTHIIYAFTNIDASNNIVTFDSWADMDLMGFNKITGLKVQNPNLKVLIALGGWSAGSQPFSDLVLSSASRATFITNLLAFLQMWNFDGLDIDWEFPGFNGGRPQDKQNFPIWLAEIRAAFNNVTANGGKYYELSFAASASSLVIDTAYDIPSIVPSVDFIDVMAYDFHSSDEPVVDHHSPLYSYAGEAQPTFNTDWAVKKYLQSGVPPSKLNVGMPLYGRGWTLANASQNTILSPGAGASAAGPYLQTAGVLSYLEICQDLGLNGWIKASGLNRTYATGQGQWAGYDAVEDGTKKANYVVQNGLGGIMFWELSYEDFNNLCGGGKYPVVNAVKTVFKQASTGTTNTPTSTTASSTMVTNAPSSTMMTEATTESTATSTATTETSSTDTQSTDVTTATSSVSTSTTIMSTTNVAPSQQNLICLKEGFYTDPRYSDCSQFVRCVKFWPNQPLVVYLFMCPSGTVEIDIDSTCLRTAHNTITLYYKFCAKRCV